MDFAVEYEKWLTSPVFDEETKAELRSLDAAEREDRFYTGLSFGTAGMRGVLGAGLNRMNVYNVRRATCALAKYILSADAADRGVVIAYDSRRKSDVFAKAAALTLAAQGVKAYLFPELRPVPVLSFTVRHMRAVAGIVITASHNPAKYNGYKVYWEDGGQMPPERAGEIQRLIAETSFEEAVEMEAQEALDKGLLVMLDGKADDAYMAEVTSLSINPEMCRQHGGDLKIVYTPLNGSGNKPVRRALDALGFTDVHVVAEQEHPDPDFSTVAVPNPEEPGAFKLALALREQIGADLVFGTDPDCDRVGIAVLDGQGEAHILTGNETGCLLLNYILTQRAALGTLPANAAAVKSVVSTELARAICRKFGCEMIDVLTGFKYIAEQIQIFSETGAHSFVFGFEESCGYLSGCEVRDKDGVNAAILIAECALYYKMRGMTLYDAMQAIYEEFGYYGASVYSMALTGQDGLRKMGALMRSLRDDPPAEFAGKKVLAVRDYQTGLRTADGGEEKLTLPQADVLYWEIEGGAWICVRPSGTEPKVKLYVNAAEKSAAQLEDTLQALLREAKDLMGSRVN